MRPARLLVSLLAVVPAAWGCGSAGSSATSSAADGAAPLADASAPDAGHTLTLLTNRGTAIVDGSGRPVTLRGVNLGGAWEWEGWMWGGGFVGQTAIQDHLASVIGQAATDAFTQRVYASFIQEEDIQRIRALGFNVVRVPISRKLLEDPSHPGSFLASGWQVLDQLLAWCDQYGVYAVIDLHCAPGGQSNLFIADPERTLLWDSSDAQNRTLALWSAIAARYADRGVVAGYDLLNEPAPPSGAALHDMDVSIARAIRAVDSRHLLFVEGASSATDFSMFPAPIDPKMVYSFHEYGTGQSLQSAVDGFAALAKAQNVPSWAGEFGGDLGQDAGAAVQIFDAAGVAGEAFWSWKVAGNASWHLFSATSPSPDWLGVMAWIDGASSAQPTADEVDAGIGEFFAAAQIAACTENPSIASALLP